MTDFMLPSSLAPAGTGPCCACYNTDEETVLPCLLNMFKLIPKVGMWPVN